jgi:hypothetical protein
MHHAAQIMGLCVSIAHVGLLAGMYLSVGGAFTDTFVSAILDSSIPFKVLFTAVVVLEVSIAAAYIFLSRPHLSLPWACIAGLCLFATLGSWITVASSHSGTPWHFNGAAVFVVASGAYTAFLIARARRYMLLYISLLATDISCAWAFTALLLNEYWHASAVLEWLTFLLQGITLVIYYYETPIAGIEAHAENDDAAAEAARPLLPVVAAHHGGRH